MNYEEVHEIYFKNSLFIVNEERLFAQLSNKHRPTAPLFYRLVVAMMIERHSALSDVDGPKQLFSFSSNNFSFEIH